VPMPCACRALHGLLQAGVRKERHRVSVSMRVRGRRCGRVLGLSMRAARASIFLASLFFLRYQQI
jgi:hypothetical protein